MGFGLPENLLDRFMVELRAVTLWSATLYIAGTVIVIYLVLEVFVMLRRSVIAMRINSPFNAAIVTDSGRIFGKAAQVDEGLLWAGYKRMGTVTARETWAAVDDEGNQVGDSVELEFYEHLKK